MRHLEHAALQRERRAAEQIDHAAAVLRIDVLEVEQHALPAKQALDDLAALVDLAYADDSLTVRVLRLCGGGCLRAHARIVNHIAAALRPGQLVLVLLLLVAARRSAASGRGGLLPPAGKGILRKPEGEAGLLVLLLVHILFLDFAIVRLHPVLVVIFGREAELFGKRLQKTHACISPLSIC